VTFNSLQYAIFLPIVLLLYWNLRRRGQNLLLLAASYLFYSFWDWRFLGLLMLSTTVDYVTGRVLARTDDGSHRRWVLAVSIITNLGILGFFKYFNFFIDSAERLLGKVGLDISPPLLHIALPVGISFYTFHGMSYTIDLFRRRIQPATSIIDFAAFVSFFPQLVAGPIGRADFQLPQFERERTMPDSERVVGSLALILLGLFKKVAIADAVAPVATAAFSTPNIYGWPMLLVGAYAFALQIYGDFSGYTDMARGSARLLGFELPPNFEQPYLSRNIAEFWRTWHISLSSWLRDYLYVPLGGNRGSARATYRNLFLVMLIGGLWHGAAWTFVVWGALHGGLLAAHKWWTDWRHTRPHGPTALPDPSTAADELPTMEPVGKRRVLVAEPVPVVTRPQRLPDWVLRVATFHVVVVFWVFFRAGNIGNALTYLGNIVQLQRASGIDWDDVLVVAIAMAVTLVIDIGQRRARDDKVLLQLRPTTRGLVVGAIAVGILLFSGGTPVPFIYFQF
jgi:D-alanyl-lipoteichoic acid acyltransferase DltB (MBOAT superfamily)